MVSFKIAFRNLKRNKTNSLINIFGLSVGISSCVVIYLIASFELSFDRFQPGYEQIYRVYTQYKSKDATRDFRGTYPAAVDAVDNNVPGIEASTHFFSWGTNSIIEGADRVRIFDNGSIAFASPDFFKIFEGYSWVEGAARTSLDKPYQVVLTESRSKIYFGELLSKEIIGKEIIYRDSIRCQVSGIVKDLPLNTDISFTEFISFSTINQLKEKAPFSLSDPFALNNSFQLFIKVVDGFSIEKMTDEIRRNTAAPNGDVVFLLMLQPLSDLHFNTILGIFDVSVRSGMKRSTIEILILLSAGLLVIACVNFVNLQTAQASKRAKEVGLKKILGSSRLNLIRQFLLESFLLTFCSMVLSIILSMAALEYFKEFIPSEVKLDAADHQLVLFLVASLFSVSLVAGIYPAIALSRFSPMEAVRERASSGKSLSKVMRRGLTVFQFSFSQALIIATTIIVLQVDFMLRKDLGFATQNIFTFRLPSDDGISKAAALKTALLQMQDIENVCLQSQPPAGGDGSNSVLMSFREDPDNESWINAKFGDINYIDVYDLKLVAGRNFIEADSGRGYIVNEAYLAKVGIANPIDIIGETANNIPIVGVVKNFHTESLHSQVQPAVIVCDERKFNSFGVKIRKQVNGAEFQQITCKVANQWKQVYGDASVDFSFVDERISRYYEAEQRVIKLAGLATMIAILISCLGLFALSSFTVIERTKEIGVRKVLGASVGNIFRLLSKEFIILFIVSFLLSAPLAYYFSDAWLSRFAFKIVLSPGIFLLSAFFALAVVFITIGYRIVAAAASNPVNSLRYR